MYSAQFGKNIISHVDFRYKESDLIKLDILINGDRVEPLSTIVHKDKVFLIDSVVL